MDLRQIESLCRHVSKTRSKNFGEIRYERRVSIIRWFPILSVETQGRSLCLHHILSRTIQVFPYLSDVYVCERLPPSCFAVVSIFVLVTSRHSVHFMNIQDGLCHHTQSPISSLKTTAFAVSSTRWQLKKNCRFQPP